VKVDYGQYKEDLIKMVKAGLRILFKSFRLAWRAWKRFLAFITLYLVVIYMVTYLLMTGQAISIVIAILGGVVVATLYGFLLTTFRKTEIATFKCIGWSNSNIRILIVGEILLVSVLAFLIFIEIGIHVTGLAFYLSGNPFSPLFFVPGSLQEVLLARNQLLVTFFVVVLAQIPGILLANYRILAVKPMEALRMQ
jgi:predicted lysophospholipase L1 biosynthesis ABC-type transport system permease subunit